MEKGQLEDRRRKLRVMAAILFGLGIGAPSGAWIASRGCPTAAGAELLPASTVPQDNEATVIRSANEARRFEEAFARIWKVAG